MKRWVFTFRVEPPTGCVFSALTFENGSYFFCSYSKLLGWQMVYPGGAERIDEPDMIFVTKEYADTHRREGATRRPTIRLREGKHKAVQYQLAL